MKCYSYVGLLFNIYYVKLRGPNKRLNDDDLSKYTTLLPIIPVLKMIEHCKMNCGADSRKASKIPRPRASL